MSSVKQQMLTLTERFKKYQHKNALVVGVSVGIFVLVFMSLDRPQSTKPKSDAADQTPLHDITKTVEDKNVWMFESAKRLSEQEKKQAVVMNELSEIKKSLAEYTQNLNKKELTEEKPPEQAIEPLPTMHFPSYSEPAPQSFSGPARAQSMNTIFSETLSLTGSPEKQTPHINSYIPAGTYAKAVLLSGVDVSAGVSSQSSPKPVLLRLINKGSLPNRAVGKMKECRIIAAAYGDLSSERAYMRLEKLSCVETDGHVIETDVDGYISGEDGKNGVRGNVVLRDTEVLTRGFMGGLLSGLGKAASSSFSSTSVSPFGSVNTSNAKGADIFKQAGAQGAGDAFELMAKYNIQRAEQYQPVIQISAGRTVDVVFHSGSEFGEQNRKEKRMTSTNTQNNFQFPNQQPSSGANP